MFVKRTLNHIKLRWRGSAVRVAIEGHDLLLGDGEPHTEIVVHRPALLHRLWHSPSMALGEAYMRGDIDVRGPMIELLRDIYLTWPQMTWSWHNRVIERLRSLPRRISASRAVANARRHYDIGNDFYRLWLDPSLTYSCAYFLHDDDDLATAQQQKLELLCRKARLQSDQSLLDIGCGWGSLLFHAARHYGVHATGVTPAAEQARHIEAEAARQGLGDRVHVILGDWRQVHGRFDRIISVGMFEHVGLEQYAQFFHQWRELLAEGGLSILHTIGRMSPQCVDPWIDKYIFPGGYMPTLAQIAGTVAEADLRILDVENLHQHYAKTLAHWSARFAAVRDQVASMYDETFARKWWLYLQGSEAAFRWGELQLWQVVLARDAQAPWPLNREVNMAAPRVIRRKGRSTANRAGRAEMMSHLSA